MMFSRKCTLSDTLDHSVRELTRGIKAMSDLQISMVDKVKSLEAQIISLKNKINEPVSTIDVVKNKSYLNESAMSFIRKCYEKGMRTNDIHKSLKNTHPDVKYGTVFNFIGRDKVCGEIKHKRSNSEA